MSDVKYNMWNKLNTAFLNYAPTEEALTRKLENIKNEYWILSQDAYTKYLGNLEWIKDNMYYDSDKLFEYEKNRQELEQYTTDNLYRNNWEALAWMTYWDIDTLVANNRISSDLWETIKWQQYALWVNKLKEYWTPTPSDMSLYKTLLDKWLNPEEAMAQVVSNNKANYPFFWQAKTSATSTASSKVWIHTDPITWIEYYKDANWRVTDEEVMPRDIKYKPITEEEITTWKEWLSTQKVWEDWWRCWSFVNNYFQSMWLDRKFGTETIDERKGWITSKEPVDWSIVLYDFSNAPEWAVSDAWRKHWHVWVITSDWQWWWILTDSNSLKDGKKNTIESEPLNLNNQYIAWYIQPMKESKISSTDTNKISDFFENKWYDVNTTRENTIKAEKDIINRWITADEYIEENINEYKKNIPTEIRPVLSNIALSWNFTKKQENVLINRINQLSKNNNPYESLLMWASSAFKSTTKSDIVAYRAFRKDMVQLSDDLQEMKDSWVEFGFIDWTLEDLETKIRLISDWDDVRMQKLASSIKQTLMSYRKAYTWVAFSEKETKEYNTIFPKTNQTFSFNKAMVDSLLNKTDIKIDSTFADVLWKDFYYENYEWWNVKDTTNKKRETNNKQEVDSKSEDEKSLEEIYQILWF
jgi:hypothetical protein